MRTFFSGNTKNENALREAIEDYIEEPESPEAGSISRHERLLLSNILNLRDVRVYDVMIPRADIAALNVDTAQDDLFAFLSENPYSRFPVYRGTLDDVLGTIHIKDIVAAQAKKKTLVIKDMITDVPIVSPAMPILDLLLEMRHTCRHMVMVVDEYGGIDGLVTIGDIIETIIGEIDDEHDRDEDPQITEEPDGAIIIDARFDIEEFEKRYGFMLSEEEREESDTLGGLIFAMAGRIPARGEVLTHDTGMVFEVLEADPRRISRLKIRNIPQNTHES